MLGLEAIALVYIAAVTWLLSAWFIDDHMAAQMEARDWWIIALQRVLVGAIVAATTGATVYLVNRVARRWLSIPAGLPLVVARIAFVVPLCAAIAGAMQFAITKPYF